VVDADAKADRLRREADRVARMSGLLAERDAALEARALLQAARAELEAERATLDRAWAEQWRGAKAVTLRSPREMRGFVARREAILQGVREAESSGEESERIGARLKLDHVAVLAALAAADSAAVADTRWPALLDRTERVLDELEDVRARRREFTDTLRDLTAQRTVLENESTEHGRALEQWAQEWAAAAGLLASDVLLPVPSSFVSAFAVGALGPVLGAVSVWTGMTAGALIGYAVGHGGGRPLVARVVGPSELARADRLFARYGKGVLVVCRGVPVLAEASVLLAGAARMPLVGFAWVTSAAHVGLALAYALVTSFGAEGAWAMLAPFALGIAVPALAILVLKRAPETEEGS
jgi:uncharacterized membrane protein YdjX (TVP38/TMEM64 family)